MRTLRTVPPVLTVIATLAVAAAPSRGERPEVAPAPRALGARYVDDDEVFAKLTESIAELAALGKCLGPKKLARKVETDFTCQLTPTAPADRRLDPEDVYEAALPGVFVLGSVIRQPNDDGEVEYVEGRLGTAWALAADGVLVTNRHMLDNLEDGEFLGVMDHAGRAYPVTDVLAADAAADVAVVRVAADGLTPLPVAERPARVGAWVGVLGHPADRYFMFTQGHVSRYTRILYDDGVTERWMAVTADYATGSSGSPVLDRRGAVVGMAALTESLDSPEELAPEPPKDGQKPKEKDTEEPKPVAMGSRLQMVVKLTVPAEAVRKVIGAE